MATTTKSSPTQSSLTKGGEVLGRLDRIRDALDVGEGRFDPAAVRRARAVLDRTDERLRLGGDFTVVALVGATGSGKSSLFNAICGMEIAEAGVRRPMTSQAMACVWGADDAEPLLDWLGVPRRHRMSRESVLDAADQQDLHGLVLLDLPDHDSTDVANKLEVERLVELVDLMIWVVDPQKYADEALHAYLRRLTRHDPVMLVVLNQLDKLSASEARTCTTDLRRLLDADGLPDVRMLTCSAREGVGVDAVREVLIDLVERQGAFAERAMADVQSTVGELSHDLAPSEPDPGALPGADALINELADAAGLPVVLEAVTADYRRQAAGVSGWPPARWLGRLRRDPLRKLGLGAEDEAEVRRLAGTAVPAPTPAQQAKVELAVHDLVDSVAADLPAPWADSVRAAVSKDGGELTAELDSAVLSVDLSYHRPAWWAPLDGLEVALALATVVGIIWSAVVFASRLGGGAGVAAPELAGVALPYALAGGGLVLGLILTGLARWFVTVGARNRRHHVARGMREAVSGVAEDLVIKPISDVLAEHRLAREALAPEGAFGESPAPVEEPEPIEEPQPAEV